MLGECTGQMLLKLKEIGWGRMFIRMLPAPYQDEPWGFDNGMFSLFTTSGRPRRVGQKELSAGSQLFIARMTNALKATTALPTVAVIPDLPFQGARSLEYSLEWLPTLTRSWPWFLAVQEGMDPQEVDRRLNQVSVSGIFLGGSSHRQGRVWAEIAQRHNLRLHYGRCGTVRKLRHAYALGCHSVDSAFPMWTKERLAEFMREWFRLPERNSLLRPQPTSRGTGP